MSRSNMYNYQQYAFAFNGSFTQLSFGDYGSTGEEWCFDQGCSSAASRTVGGAKHQKDQRALEKNVAKMRKEWTKVKEEMGHLKQHGKNLSEALTQTDKKVAMMLVELEQVDKYMRDLMAQNDD